MTFMTPFMGSSGGISHYISRNKFLLKDVERKLYKLDTQQVFESEWCTIIIFTVFLYPSLVISSGFWDYVVIT